MIATFQALLLMARVEAGSTHQALAEVDANAIASDVVDLYQPVAEAGGISLSYDEAAAPVPMSANRELVAQGLTKVKAGAGASFQAVWRRNPPPSKVCQIYAES